MDAQTLATGADGPYWQGLIDGKLCLPQCAECGRWHWPAVFRCASCGSWDLEWHDVPATGTVYSWTRNWHPFDGLPAIDLPFVVAVVSLDEAGGIRLMGIVDGADQALQIGARVEGRVAETDCAGHTVPALRWRLSEGDGQ